MLNSHKVEIVTKKAQKVFDYIKNNNTDIYNTVYKNGVYDTL